MIEFIAGCIAGVVIAKKVRAVTEWKPPSRIRIVKISDGKYAIRKGYFAPYEFLGCDNSYWWPKGEYLNKHCLRTLERCNDDIKDATASNGTPV